MANLDANLLGSSFAIQYHGGCELLWQIMNAIIVALGDYSRAEQSRTSQKITEQRRAERKAPLNSSDVARRRVRLDDECSCERMLIYGVDFGGSLFGLIRGSRSDIVALVRLLVDGAVVVAVGRSERRLAAGFAGGSALICMSDCRGSRSRLDHSIGWLCVGLNCRGLQVSTSVSELVATDPSRRLSPQALC